MTNGDEQDKQFEESIEELMREAELSQAAFEGRRLGRQIAEFYKTLLEEGIKGRSLDAIAVAYIEAMFKPGDEDYG